MDRSIPPGGEGKIMIKLFALSCHGDTKKVAFVFCNDPQNPYFQLTVQGRDR
jgi:hypothetical protein